MLFDRTLQRASESEITNRTITIEDTYPPPLRYTVQVCTYKAQTAPPESTGPEADIQRHDFKLIDEALSHARKILKESLENGYIELP